VLAARAARVPLRIRLDPRDEAALPPHRDAHRARRELAAVEVEQLDEHGAEVGATVGARREVCRRLRVGSHVLQEARDEEREAVRREAAQVRLVEVALVHKLLEHEGERRKRRERGRELAHQVARAQPVVVAACSHVQRQGQTRGGVGARERANIRRAGGSRGGRQLARKGERNAGAGRGRCCSSVARTHPRTRCPVGMSVRTGRAHRAPRPRTLPASSRRR
jgi:hypothetical protein